MEQGLGKQPQPPSFTDPHLDCIHCGLCLPKCPTYQLLGSEADSPRGRLYLMKALREERLDPDPVVVGHLDRCLACRACESACPSGVRFEVMLTRTRSELRPALPLGWRRRLVFDHLLPYPRRVGGLAWLIRRSQGLGFSRWIRASRLARRLAPGLVAAESQLAPLPPSFRTPERLSASGTRRYRVGYVRGCVMPHLLPEAQRATVGLLRLAGCDVQIPKQQACCGALHLHEGLEGSARELAQRNLRAFSDSGLDAIIVDSAGCGAALKEYGAWLAQGQAALARGFAGRVRDICEFLWEIGIPFPLRPLNLRLAYDDPCHLIHGQQIARQPRELLSLIPGVRLVDFPNPDRCCGAAGLYSLNQRQLADQLTERKVDEVLLGNPDRIVTGNPGCILRLRQFLERRGLSIPVQHPVEVLWQAAEPRG